MEEALLEVIDDESLVRTVDTTSDRFTALKDYMERTGRCPPVEVRENGDVFTLIDGANRVMAAHLLGWQRIPAICREDIRDEVHAREEALASFNRVPPKPMDLARGLEGIKKARGYSLDQLAQATGMTRAQVDMRLKIKELSGRAAEFVDKGAIPLETAKYLAKLLKNGQDPNEVEGLVTRCASEPASQVIPAIKALINKQRPNRKFPGRKKQDLVRFFLAIEDNPDFTDEFKQGVLYALGVDSNG